MYFWYVRNSKLLIFPFFVGNKIKGYMVSYKQKKEVNWTDCKHLTKNCHYKVTSLTPNIEYEFRACAENDAGRGDHCQTPIPIRCQETVPAPTKPQVVDVEATNVTIAWTQPPVDEDRTSRVTGFEVERKDLVRKEENWTLCTYGGLSAPKFTVRGLEENHEYTFRFE